MFQTYPETSDNVPTLIANPRNMWCRILTEEKCQVVAAGLHRAYQNTNVPFNQSRCQIAGPCQHRDHKTISVQLSERMTSQAPSPMKILGFYKVMEIRSACKTLQILEGLNQFRNWDPFLK